jgi:DNA mismatch endonuclease (patch repair protein)
MMSQIRSRDTKPERIVRSLLHRLGYRFRVHRKDLPGTPDIVFPGRRKVAFVHGCFWHRHPGCRFAYEPKSNEAVWQHKFRGNVRRDVQKRALLEEGGWEVLVVWECETRNTEALATALKTFLE